MILKHSDIKDNLKHNENYKENTVSKPNMSEYPFLSFHFKNIYYPLLLYGQVQTL